VGKAADCQSATQQITNLYTLLTDVSSLTRRLRVAGKVYYYARKVFAACAKCSGGRSSVKRCCGLMNRLMFY